MSLLKELQDQFCTALFEKNVPFSLPIKSTYAKERFNIYRKNIVENLRNTLCLTFPGIWSLLGEKCANSVAYAFLRKIENLPSTGCLSDWGNSFPIFLETVPELQALPYLRDFAWYEWLQHLCYGALHESSLALEEVQQFCELEVDKMKISYVSSVFFYSSCYPINKIQEVINDPKAQELNINEGPCFGIIVRENRVLSHWLSASYWHFFTALEKGNSLKKAYTSIHRNDPDFDLTAAFQFLLQKKLIQQVSFDN